MAHVVVWHQVEDFDHWRRKFDEHGEARGAAGSKGGTVYRSSDNSQEVVVVLEWDKEDNARAFFASQNLEQVMADAGVTGQPMVAFLDDGEAVPA
jgi:heme-degrading monooxygenase HmoA